MRGGWGWWKKGMEREMGVGVRRDLQRRNSLNTEQSSDNSGCLNYSLQLKSQSADIFPPLSLGSIIFKEMALALM